MLDFSIWLRKYRSCRSTLSRRRISWVKVRWKAVVSELSCHLLSAPCSIASIQKLCWKLHNTSTHTHISEIHDPKLSKGRDNLVANLVGDVKLGQGHVRGAEHGVLGGRHDGGSRDKTWTVACLSRGVMGADAICEMVVDGELPRTPAMMRRTRSLAPCSTPSLTIDVTCFWRPCSSRVSPPVDHHHRAATHFRFCLESRY